MTNTLEMVALRVDGPVEHAGLMDDILEVSWGTLVYSAKELIADIVVISVTSYYRVSAITGGPLIHQLLQRTKNTRFTVSAHWLQHHDTHRVSRQSSS